MFDFRYHIVSIIAVFFALALGLLVGGSVAERGIVEKQRQIAFDKLIGSIREDVKKLQNDNRSLKNELEVLNKFTEESYPALVDGKLLLKNILLIASGDGSAGINNDMKKAVTDAGGNAYSVNYLGVARLSSTDAAALLTEVDLASADSAQIDALIKEKIYFQLTSSLDTIFWDSLKAKKIVEITGSPAAPVGGVGVFYKTGGDDQLFSSSDAAIFDQFIKAGKPIVAVDNSNSKQSFLPVFKTLDLSTVDNFERTIGKVSFIYALAGQAGHFGELPQAEQLVPDLSLGAGN